jgi:hypothetical protein
LPEAAGRLAAPMQSQRTHQDAINVNHVLTSHKLASTIDVPEITRSEGYVPETSTDQEAAY